LPYTKNETARLRYPVKLKRIIIAVFNKKIKQIIFRLLYYSGTKKKPSLENLA